MSQPSMPFKLDDASILITGGTGSLGRAVVSHLLKHTAARRIIVFSRDEYKQWQMQEEMIDQGGRLRFFIGDIRDRSRLQLAFAGVDAIVHAAAMKHVAASEFNPFEAVQSNILGSQNVIEAALEARVARVLAVSTDKASNPVSLYGATKLVGDRMFIHSNAYLGAHAGAFSVIRFGNLAGSRGSILPKFRRIAQLGQPLPITDPQATRFWIRLKDAAANITAALTDMQGGEMFVPKAPSLTIYDLAKAIVPDAEHHIVGLRPGEKKHEELIGVHDAPYTFEQGCRYVVAPASSHRYLEISGRRVAGDFTYSSDRNDQWLTPDQIKRTIQ